MIGIIDGGEKKVVLGAHAGCEHLGNVHPFFFICRRKNVKRSQCCSQQDGRASTEQNSWGTLGNCGHDYEQCHRVVHYHRGRGVSQPRGGND